jgi:hypothetical protein
MTTWKVFQRPSLSPRANVPQDRAARVLSKPGGSTPLPGFLVGAAVKPSPTLSRPPFGGRDAYLGGPYGTAVYESL